ncbi:hypothetical protein EV127DRAFT_509375 [Xylaria flabelliformis]|nr:hypothetical protein EV127DRAFT_509375 [Xylaria flabelliformis]
MSLTQSVHIGFWTNWSKGEILGSTLTLSRSDANLLIAFLAFWVTIVTSHIWKLTCFILHAFFSSTSEPQDGFYHQRQLLLRNSSGPGPSVWTLLQIIWAWRKLTWKPYSKGVPLLVIAIFLAIGFAAVSGLSSRVVTGNEVLISNSSCGLILQPQTERDQKETYEVYIPYLVNNTIESAIYAQKCYTANAASSADCGVYVQHAIAPHSINFDSSCPFAPHICKLQGSNIVVDSGLLSSDEHFGVNTSPDQRVQLRQVTSCAPLVTEGYNSSAWEPEGRQVTRYHYGTSLSSSSSTSNDEDDYTFQFPNVRSREFLKIGYTYGIQDYNLVPFSAHFLNGSIYGPYSFIPITDLQRNNSDIVLIGLSSSNLKFLEKTNDPWYRATRDLGGAFQADEAGQALGCSVQQQFCHSILPSSKNCTSLSSLYDTFVEMSDMLAAHEAELQRFQWIYSAAISAGLDLKTILQTLGTQALTSRNTLTSNTQGPLADNQWQLDVLYWYSIQMALIQKAFINTALGPSDPRLVKLGYYQPPTSTVEEEMCRNQKMISTAFVSFSVLGLAVIAFSGVLIVAFSMAILPLANLTLSLLKKDASHLREWSAGSPYQLHRLANEEIGAGTWSRADEDIPVTKEYEALALLEFSDPSHTRLKPPPQKYCTYSEHGREYISAQTGGE